MGRKTRASVGPDPFFLPILPPSRSPSPSRRIVRGTGGGSKRNRRFGKRAQQIFEAAHKRNQLSEDPLGQSWRTLKIAEQVEYEFAKLHQFAKLSFSLQAKSTASLKQLQDPSQQDNRDDSEKSEDEDRPKSGHGIGSRELSPRPPTSDSKGWLSSRIETMIGDYEVKKELTGAEQGRRSTSVRHTANASGRLVRFHRRAAAPSPDDGDDEEEDGEDDGGGLVGSVGTAGVYGSEVRMMTTVGDSGALERSMGSLRRRMFGPPSGGGAAAAARRLGAAAASGQAVRFLGGGGGSHDDGGLSLVGEEGSGKGRADPPPR